MSILKNDDGIIYACDQCGVTDDEEEVFHHDGQDMCEEHLIETYTDRCLKLAGAQPNARDLSFSAFAFKGYEVDVGVPRYCGDLKWISVSWESGNNTNHDVWIHFSDLMGDK